MQEKPLLSSPYWRLAAGIVFVLWLAIFLYACAALLSALSQGIAV